VGLAAAKDLGRERDMLGGGQRIESGKQERAARSVRERPQLRLEHTERAQRAA
jgi:hypothetical protein